VAWHSDNCSAPKFQTNAVTIKQQQILADPGNKISTNSNLVRIKSISTIRPEVLYSTLGLTQKWHSNYLLCPDENSEVFMIISVIDSDITIQKLQPQKCNFFTKPSAFLIFFWT